MEKGGDLVLSRACLLHHLCVRGRKFSYPALSLSLYNDVNCRERVCVCERERESVFVCVREGLGAKIQVFNRRRPSSSISQFSLEVKKKRKE